MEFCGNQSNLPNIPSVGIIASPKWLQQLCLKLRSSLLSALSLIVCEYSCKARNGSGLKTECAQKSQLLIRKQPGLSALNAQFRTPADRALLLMRLLLALIRSPKTPSQASSSCRRRRPNSSRNRYKLPCHPHGLQRGESPSGGREGSVHS